MADSLYALMTYVALPVPAVFLLAAAFLAWRARRLRRVLTTLGLFCLFVPSVPVVGKVALVPLVARPSAAADVARASVVVVPTGGAFSDGMGKWWMADATAYRIAVGDALRRRLGVPMIVSGGNPDPDAPPEAKIAVRQMGLESDPGVVIDRTARNTYETALAVRAAIKTEGAVIALVTSPYHAARAAATLRGLGLSVIPVRTGEWGWIARDGVFAGWQDLVPSTNGYSYATRAGIEYAAILWYWAKGRLRLSDL